MKQLHQAISREADKIMFCIGTKVILEKNRKKSSKKTVILFKSKPLSCIFPQATTEGSRISTDLARLHRFYFNYSWAKYTIEEWVVISSLFKYIFLYTLRERGWNTITHQTVSQWKQGLQFYLQYTRSYLNRFNCPLIYLFLLTTAELSLCHELSVYILK